MAYEELSVTKRMRVGGTIGTRQEATLLVSGTLDVGNEVTFHGPLTAMGQVDIGTDDKRANLHVKGDGDLDGQLQVADHVGIGTAPDRDYLLKVDGDTSLGGDLRVSGPLYAPSSLRIISDTTKSWGNTTLSTEWVRLLEKKIILSARTHLLVLGHGHGRTIGPDARLDLVIVINGEFPPMGDEGLYYGMGVTHATNWVPMIAVWARLLHEGEHTIELKYRQGKGVPGQPEPSIVHCCGVSMHIMLLGSAL